MRRSPRWRPRWTTRQIRSRATACGCSYATHACRLTGGRDHTDLSRDPRRTSPILSQGRCACPKAANLVADHALVSVTSSRRAPSSGRPRQGCALSARPSRRLACRGALASAFAGTCRPAEGEIVRARHEFEQADLTGEDEVVRAWRSTLAAPKQYWRLRRCDALVREASRVGDACLSAMLRLNDVSDLATMWPFPTTDHHRDRRVPWFPPTRRLRGHMLGEYIPALRRRLAEQVTATSVDKRPGVASVGSGCAPTTRSRTASSGSRSSRSRAFAGSSQPTRRSASRGPRRPVEAVGSDEALSVTPALHPAARTPGAWVSSRLADRPGGGGTATVARSPRLCLLRARAPTAPARERVLRGGRGRGPGQAARGRRRRRFSGT